MGGFRFLFVELLRETTAMKAMAKDLFDSNTSFVLDQFQSNLKSMECERGERVRTLKFNGLCTVPSREYEIGNREGGQDVHAIISGIWELRSLGPKPGPRRQVEFCGKASTLIELYESDKPCQPFAIWQFDLGDDGAPGCYIHVQIPWGFNAPTPSPKLVPIPRLPCIFVTPMGAVEFVLGELFHDRWGRTTAQRTDDALRWRSLQKERLKRIFSWYQDHLENSVSSPWMALKAAKPGGEEFLTK